MSTEDNTEYVYFIVNDNEQKYTIELDKRLLKFAVNRN